MPLNDRYRRQVALLIAAVPFVAAEREFALKGGTAINLFVRDMQRLSVDTREHSLSGIASPTNGKLPAMTTSSSGHEKL